MMRISAEFDTMRIIAEHSTVKLPDRSAKLAGCALRAFAYCIEPHLLEANVDWLPARARTWDLRKRPSLDSVISPHHPCTPPCAGLGTPVQKTPPAASQISRGRGTVQGLSPHQDRYP
jgi:hypothetical protein